MTNKAVFMTRTIRTAVVWMLLLSAHVWACGPCLIPGSCGTDDHAADASGSYAHPDVASEPAVSTPTLEALMLAGAPIALIDCRAAGSLAEPRIPGAMVFLAGSTPASVAERFPAKDMLMILYDGGSSTARVDVRKQLSDAGFTNILHYSDGIRGWTAAGHPTVPTASDSLIGFEGKP